MRLRIVAEGQEGIGWARWLDLAQRCEALGFEALFRSDHYRTTVGAGGATVWTHGPRWPRSPP